MRLWNGIDEVNQARSMKARKLMNSAKFYKISYMKRFEISEYVYTKAIMILFQSSRK